MFESEKERSTKLGSHLAGRTKNYEIQSNRLNPVKFHLDERRLIFSMEGSDYLKQIVIDKLAKPIGANRYKVDFKSFLKGCSTKEAVQAKIQLFRQHISDEVPLNWESFFENTMARVDPLSFQKDWVVYRLQENDELIQLMATNNEIAKYILKGTFYTMRA